MTSFKENKDKSETDNLKKPLIVRESSSEKIFLMAMLLLYTKFPSFCFHSEQ